LSVLSATLSPSSQTITGVAGVPIASTNVLIATNFAGAVTYNIAPALPSGLALNTNTGVVSGTPSIAIPTTSYVITGTGASSGTATTSLTITLTSPPIITPSSQTRNATRGVAIAATSAYAASNFGGTVSYTISPSLPAGLSFSNSTGVVSGTPTAASAKTTYNVTAVGSTSGVATATIVLGVSALTPLSQTVTSTKGVAMTATATLSASNFEGSVSYSVSPSLPTGLSINAATGSISGTPFSGSARTTYTITATGSVSGTASVTVSLAATDMVPVSQSLALVPNQAMTPTSPFLPRDRKSVV
jgi:hypothetical protein